MRSRRINQVLFPAAIFFLVAANQDSAEATTYDYVFGNSPLTHALYTGPAGVPAYPGGPQPHYVRVNQGLVHATLEFDPDSAAGGTFTYSLESVIQLVDAATGRVLDQGKISISGSYSQIYALDAAGHIINGKAPEQFNFGTAQTGSHAWASTDMQTLSANGYSMFDLSYVVAEQYGFSFAVSSLFVPGMVTADGWTIPIPTFGAPFDLHWKLIRTSEVPEPMTAVLLGSALAGAAFRRRAKRVA